MNPIEMAFAKLKTLLRQAPERTRDGLWRRIGDLLDRFTPDECANYFHSRRLWRLILKMLLAIDIFEIKQVTLDRIAQRGHTEQASRGAERRSRGGRQASLCYDTAHPRREVFNANLSTNKTRSMGRRRRRDRGDDHRLCVGRMGDRRHL